MTIKSLKITNFRNFAGYDLEPDKITILIGPNGAGKTNLLEAIFLLSVCRSYRTRRDQEVIRWESGKSRMDADGDADRRGSSVIARSEATRQSHEILKRVQDDTDRSGPDTARVSAEIETDGGDKLSLALAQTGDKKIAFVGENQAPVSLMVGKLPTVLFAPEEMDLPAASPQKRRRELNIFLSQLEQHYMRHLLEYNKVLRARNKLLDSIAAGRGKEDELDFWDKQLVHFGTSLIKSRLAIAKEFNRHVITCYNTLSGDGGGSIGGDKRKLEFVYLSTIQDVERFGEELAAAREREIRYRSTTVGPHRDDWQLRFDGVDIRASASRGETRAALLAFKMAQMEILRATRNETPVMLLDDVFAELDKHHSQTLMRLIDSSQVIITATDAEYIPESIRKKATIVEINTR